MQSFLLNVRRAAVVTCVILLGSSLCLNAGAQVVVDGRLGTDGYGSALSLQNTDTQFGDAFIGDAVQTGGGSEIDGFYAKIENGRLNVLVTGNLEENFNKLTFFFDTRSGGHNVIDGSMLPTGVDGFCCGGLNTTSGALQRMSGLTFDSGFEADYLITLSNGFETALDDPNSPGNPITFWAATAHYSDLTAGADPAKQNVAAGMQLAPNGLPNVLRLNGSTNFGDPPYLPDFLTFGPTNPMHIGPALPNLGQGELIDRNYALSDGGCPDDTGTGCVTTELGFALDQSPSDPTNSLSHRRFNNLVDLQLGVDNSNFDGVVGGTGQTAADPSTVQTGIEISIPLSQLGNPNGDFKVVAFVNGSGHHYASNQWAGDGILSGNPGGDGMGGCSNPPDCVDLSGVNLNNYAGNQFVTIPYTPPTIDGDFNNDGMWNCLDIDALTAVTAAMSNDGAFDLTGDGNVDGMDIMAWLVEGGAMNPAATGGNAFLKGDANLDGVVDGQDFIVWNTNKFTSTTAWCSGNFTGDTVVDGQDFITWNTFKFMSSDSVSVVPEPASVISGLLLSLTLVVRRSRR